MCPLLAFVLERNDMSLLVILVVGIIVMMASLECDPCRNGCCDRSDNLEEMLDKALKDTKEQLETGLSDSGNVSYSQFIVLLENMITKIKDDYRNFESHDD